MELLLFKKYPNLKKYISYISFGEFPTPILRVDKLTTILGHNCLYIKRDDLSSNIYGGNKVRKLEFIFSDVKKNKNKTIVTFGFTGSNHVLSTILHGSRLGLKCIAMLLPQKNSRYVRKNILADIYYGGEIYEYKNKLFLALNLCFKVIKIFFKDKSFPYIIPPGGSSILGILGYVNAAFELNEQINNGILIKPDIVYVPMGSSGTAAGLILGFKLLNLSIKVHGVRVADKQYVNRERLIKLINKTNKFIHKIDANIPMVKIRDDDYLINDEHFGSGYGVFTSGAINAINLFYSTTGILLEGTYTGKTFAAVMHDLINNKINNKVILFWNTYNSRELLISNENIKNIFLGERFVKYYKTPVQELDNEINFNIYDKN